MDKYTLEIQSKKHNRSLRLIIWNNTTGDIQEEETVELKTPEEIGELKAKYEEKVRKLNRPSYTETQNPYAKANNEYDE